MAEFSFLALDVFCFDLGEHALYSSTGGALEDVKSVISRIIEAISDGQGRQFVKRDAMHDAIQGDYACDICGEMKSFRSGNKNYSFSFIG